MSKTDPRPNTLVAARVANRLPMVVPRSGTTTCDDCKQDVWVSPAAMDSIRKGFITQVVCIECALPKIMALAKDER